MSDQTGNVIPPDLERLIFALARQVGLGDDALLDQSLVEVLNVLFEKTSRMEGQKFLALALALLTYLSRFLPPKVVVALNDRVVVVLRGMMPNSPTDLTGHEPSPEEIGRPNMPYARSVPVESEVAPSDLPDPGAIFENYSNAQRQKTQKRYEHSLFLSKYSGGLSSLTFAFGTLVIHSVFFTDRGSASINNKTSSYFDLAPLYGDLPSQKDETRDKGQGRGLLHPDCFADTRMLFLPPAAAVLLVLLNRNHNHIARELLSRNEKGTWSDPPPVDPVAHAKQDDEIFETACLINGLHFVNIVITDYVGGVMGMPARGGGWPGNAEVLHEICVGDKKTPRGDGNLVSIDRDWDHLVDKLGPADFERGAKTVQPHGPIKDRVFAGLERLPNGRFADKDLSEILYAATEEPAGFLRAHGTPAVMRCVELLGIEQARQWNTCTLNEFRKWLELPPLTSFEDWNAAPEVADAAKELYGDINCLELYPGLHAEGRNGDSFGKTYPLSRVDTMRNGLLLDAIALILPVSIILAYPATIVENATEWGINDVARDHHNRAFGGHIHKILKRTLPENFPDNSIYTWFPMSTPTAMKANGKLPADPSEPWDFNRPVIANL
ncbi:heme peroxidase [Collybia nuda]|uniref:Heme peroxidase n=1 Tax=Collybia nuda TaxID=64659 RepID=A0A9P6CGZ6_9AGAR|nr:heme peroxidase [Collybia nuda]